MAAAMSLVAAIFWAAGSSVRAAPVPRLEPPTVDFAEALAGDFFGGGTGFFGFVGIAVTSCRERKWVGMQRDTRLTKSVPHS
jgi:hypothetical protein